MSKSRRNRMNYTFPVVEGPCERTVFVYGILREPATLMSCIGRQWGGLRIPADLPDHTVVRQCGPAYCFPMDGDNAAGYLITGLNDKDFEYLDAVEGTEHGHYERVTCTVDTAEGPIETEFYRAGSRAVLKCLDFLTHGSPWDGNAEWDQDDSTPSVGPSAAEAWAAFEAEGLVGPDEFEIDLTAATVEPSKVIMLPAPKRHIYPCTPEHLPARIGVPLPSAKRGDPNPGPHDKCVFVYDGLRSMDRLELVLDHEWFGRRILVTVSNVKLTNSFPAFAVETEVESDRITGHFVTGLTDADLKKIDKHMNVASGYFERGSVTLESGEVAVMYYMGAEGEKIVAKQAEKSKLAASARDKATAKRGKYATYAKSSDWNGGGTATKSTYVAPTATYTKSKVEEKVGWRPVIV